jgi:hypothetical protein
MLYQIRGVFLEIVMFLGTLNHSCHSHESATRESAQETPIELRFSQ